MDILTGRKTETLDLSGLRSIAESYDETLLDVGTGSGRFVYETARRHPRILCIGVDAERRGMEAMAKRSRRKPARGGQPNVLFALSAADSLPPELHGAAGRITVNLPWGSLLAGVVKGDTQTLDSLREAAAPGAALEILATYDTKYEPRMMEAYDLPPLSPALVEETLPAAYEKVGIAIVQTRILDNQAVKGIPLDWGRALAGGRRRDFYVIVARMPGQSLPHSPPCSLLLDYTRPQPAPRAQEDVVRFTARGHANLVATHEVSIEFTRDANLSREGDCIVGVGADYDPEEVRRLADYRKLHVAIRSGPIEETFVCGVNGGFSAEGEIVFRKSSHCSPRTLGIGATKSAFQLSRLLAERLRASEASAEITITPIK